MIATIYRLDSSYYPWRWALRCDYNADLVAALKTHIHYRQRKWVPETLQWWFHDAVIEDVLSLAGRYCGRVHHAQSNRPHTGSGAPPGPGGSTAGDFAGLSPDVAAAYRTFHLLPSAPEELIKAVYRAMCKIHHPDAGGVVSEMQRVNVAYQRIVHARQKGD